MAIILFDEEQNQLDKKARVELKRRALKRINALKRIDAPKQDADASIGKNVPAHPNYLIASLACFLGALVGAALVAVYFLVQE